METSFAGTINVNWADVAEIRTEEEMEFLLTDDTVIKVTDVKNYDEDLVLEGEDGEQQTLDQDAIAVINPEPWRKGEARKFSGNINFFFERQRAEALRTRFLLNVFRLDDRLATVPEGRSTKMGFSRPRKSSVSVPPLSLRMMCLSVGESL